MSNNHQPSTPVNPAAAPPEPLPVALSPDEIVRQLRAMRAQVAPAGTLSLRALRRNFRKVDAQFVVAAVNAVGASDVVQHALGRSDEDLRQEIDASTRWAAVIGEIQSLLKDAIAANAERRNRIGLAALQAYQICRQLARDESNTQLDAFIAEMKRLNRFGRSGRKPAPPEAVKPNVQ
jgi:hypothetical protein